MSSFFSVTKKTVVIGLGLLLLSNTEAKPTQNLRAASTLSESDDPEYGCWIESYGRGVGKPISVCPNGLENQASLCYTPCRDGFNGNGPVCWQSCPAGYTNNGAYCAKPAPYQRGAGYALGQKDKCEKAHPQGCEKGGLIWYPICNPGYHGIATTCSPDCPAGMSDIGVSCQKQSYGRGVGKPLVCTSDQDENGALCYNKCKSGWTGDGPICWGACPNGMYKCGALCVPSGMACANDMLEIANKVLEGMHEASEEEDNEGKAITVADTGVDVGTQLASYGMCKNM